MFNDVSELNTLFGNPKGDPNNIDWEKLENQSKNILDEYHELLNDGIKAKNVTEVRDAICDILVFTLGAGHIAGVPVDEDMAAVDASNRSKFCCDQDNVDATVAKYTSLGVDVYVDGDFPMKRVKSTKEQTDINGNIYRKGKMLKSISFKEPIFRVIKSV
jgi:predicted HAD superfamily Cof-like phosphohydrolase